MLEGEAGPAGVSSASALAHGCSALRTLRPFIPHTLGFAATSSEPGAAPRVWGVPQPGGTRRQPYE